MMGHGKCLERVAALLLATELFGIPGRRHSACPQHVRNVFGEESYVYMQA